MVTIKEALPGSQFKYEIVGTSTVDGQPVDMVLLATNSYDLGKEVARLIGDVESIVDARGN